MATATGIRSKLSLWQGTWQKRREASALDKADPREVVWIIDSGRIWPVSLRCSKLVGKLPWDCRWQPEPTAHKWWGLGCGAGATILLFSLILAVLTNPVAGVMLAMLPFGPLGGWVGYKVGLRNEPRVFWLVRRVGDRAKVLAPVVHTLPMIDQPRAALATANGSKPSGAEGENTKAKLPMPTVFSAKSWYHNIEARPFRNYYRGAMTGLQKLQVGGLVMLTGVMAGLLVLLIIATTEGG